MGKTVVITGGTSGIGLACSEYFKNKGDTVIIMARKQPVGATNFFMCDVSIDAMVKKIFEEIHEKFGTIDILINNAGYGISGATELISADQCQEIFDVNYFGVLNCMRACLPYMKKGSKIINMSSAMALFPLPFRSLYASSKAAVNTLTFSVNMETKPAGISVVAMCPGDVKTNFTKNRVKFYDTNERYGDRVKNAASKVDNKEDKRMSAEVVAKATYKVSRKKNPKPFTIVGAKYKVLYFLTRLFPTKTIHKVIGKMFDGR